MIGSDVTLAARLAPVVRGAVEVFLARHSRDVATIDVEDAYREAMTRLLDAAEIRPISDPFVLAVAREEALKRHGTRRDAFDDLAGRSSDAEERREEARELGSRREALDSGAQLLLALALDDALDHDAVASCVGGEPGAVVKAISRARRAARSAEAPPPRDDDRAELHVGAAEISARIEAQVIDTDDRINGHLARCADCRAALREVALVPTHESPPPQDPDEQFGAGPVAIIAPPPVFDPNRDDTPDSVRLSLGAVVSLLLVLGMMGVGVWYAFRPEAIESKYAAPKFEGEFRRDGEVETPTEGMELREGDEFRTTSRLLLTTHPKMRYGISPIETTGAIEVFSGARVRVYRAGDGTLGVHLEAGDITGRAPTAFRIRVAGAIIHVIGTKWKVARYPEATPNELDSPRWSVDQERLHGKDVTLVSHSLESNTVVIESKLAGAVPVEAGDVMAVVGADAPRSLIR